MRIKRIISIVLIVVLLMPTVYASTKSVPMLPAQQVRDLNILIDNEQWKPTDPDGKPLYPAMINGSLYLPFRAVLERFGIGIDYDAVKKLLSLTSAQVARYDKASPKLMEIIAATPEKPMSEIIFDAGAISKANVKGAIQQTTLQLAEDAKFFVYDGAGQSAGKATFKEFTVTKKTDAANVRLVQDPETGLIKEVHYVREAGSGMATGRRLSIEVEISGPPFKIVITIRF